MEAVGRPTPVFIETQWAARRWWWIAVLVDVFLGIILQVVADASAGGSVLRFGMLAVATAAFLLPRLETRLDAAGVHCRFMPFVNRWQTWPWSAVRISKPLSQLEDWGGWGVRGLPGHQAYLVGDENGLLLVFYNGDQLTIGTQRLPQLTDTLRALGQLP
jgi:hypothetical protein